jgi:NTE family protein
MTSVHPTPINLALQGGGSHGAFTWGVLDRLLEDETILFEGISGTSAGAMNAAMLVSGFSNGGRRGAQALLATFWQRVSEASAFTPLRQNPMEQFFYGWNLDAAPAFHWLDAFTRSFSPYQFNPMNINPLREILEELIDINTLHTHPSMKLFITATSTRTGQPRVFQCKEVTVDALLASACLPNLYQAVEIDGESYWDGGYSGNPAIWPLIYNCISHDVMLVQITPFVREKTPATASEIVDRMNEISFNNSLLAEMRAIRFVAKLVHENKVNRKDYKELRMHLIYSEDVLEPLNASSKMNASWEFFTHLHDAGYQAAEDWLKTNRTQLGKQATFELDSVL